MNSITLIIFYLLSFLISSKEDPKYIDKKLSSIASEFREKIRDENACMNLSEEAGLLAEDCEEVINIAQYYDYNVEELNEFRRLKEDAESLRDFIHAVGNCYSEICEIDELYRANERIGGIIFSVSKNKYCSDVIGISIGNHTSYLLVNISQDFITFKCNWRTPDKRHSGSVETGVDERSCRFILDNKEHSDIKSIVITDIKCVILQRNY